MKIRIITILFSCLCLSSCKKAETIIEKPKLIESAESVEAVKNHPEIKSPNINQLKYSEIELRVTNDSSFSKPFTYKFDYFDDSKVKKISNGFNFESFAYENNKITISNSSPGDRILNLDIDGQIINSVGNNSRENYYKNGYLLRKGYPFFNSIYSEDGNLMENNDLTFNSKFTYTNLENNIRQSVMLPLSTIWDFRDTYLGKFSTNLIKKAVFTKRIQSNDYYDYELDFSYEFDANNRVNKVIIVRNVLDSIKPIKPCKFEFVIKY